MVEPGENAPDDASGWRRWTVAAVGLVLVALGAAHLVLDGGGDAGVLLEVALPLAMGLGVAVVGVRLARSDATGGEVAAVARLTAGAGLVFALVGLWVFYLGVQEGLPADEVALYAGTGGAVGGVMGLIVGIFWVRERRSRLAAERQRRQLSAVVEHAPLVLFALDAEGRFTLSEGTGLSSLGLTPGEVVGESVFDVYAGNEGVLASVERALDGEAVEETVALADRYYETWYEPVEEEGAVAGVIGVARDVTEEHAQERRLEKLHEATRTLSYATSVEAAAQVTVDIAADVLEVPVSAFLRYDETADRLELAAVSEGTEDALADAGVDELSPIGSGTPGMDAFEDGEFRVLEDYAALEDASYPELPLGTVLLVPVGRHGLLVLGSEAVTGVTDAERYRSEVLAANAAAALDRVARERDLRERHATLEALHERTRQMVTATDTEAVAEMVVDSAAEVLNLPLTAVWLVDETGARLEPVAVTAAGMEAFDEAPTYTAEDDSISWSVYESGEARVVEDVEAASDAHDPDSIVGSELVVPLGEHGVLNAGAREVGAFEDEDLQLAQLLAANAVTALERVDREQQLRRRGSQMEFFNSILRHDVLNGMTVIRGRGELLAEELEGDHRRYAETVVEWADDVVDVVRRVRTVLDALTGEGSFEPERVDVSELLAAEAERVRGTYPGVDVTVDIPDGLVVLADELLAEVLGNLLANAVEHNDPESLEVRVTADVAPETVTLRVADDGRGVPDERKDTIFRRGETAHAKTTGSGFGLFFVDSMVTEYGGSVHVEDSDLGGAAFVVTLPRPVQPSPFRENEQ
jgi:PAS domain S-box-containing protein